MLTSVILFSANCLIIKQLSFSSESLVWAASFYRCFAGVLLVLALSARKGHDYAPLIRVFKRPLLIFRGTIGSIGLVCFYYALFKMEVARASVLGMTYVIWASLFAMLFLSEHLRLKQVAGIALSFAGVPLLTGMTTSLGNFTLVDAIALGGAAAGGVAVVLVRYLIRTENSTTIYAGQCVYGLLITLPFIGWAGLFGDMGNILLMLGAGLLVATAQLIMTLGYRYLPVAQGASTQLIIPVLNCIGGIFLFAESYGWEDFVGGAFVLGGCLWVVRNKSAK